jgi:hypothetical protein
VNHLSAKLNFAASRAQECAASGNTVVLFTFDQLSALAATYHFCQPALEEVMENFTELMQRLLEIQSGGRQRSPELIAEDERLMDGLRTKLSQDCPEQTRFKV